MKDSQNMKNDRDDGGSGGDKGDKEKDARQRQKTRTQFGDVGKTLHRCWE